MKEKTPGKFSIFTNGILRENPVFRLMLGTCPTLAVTTMASNGLGMGIAATVVLIGSNVVISLIHHWIPSKVRIPAYITIIAGFVSIIQMLVQAYAPALDESLGIYLPLIVVNCIILARAEMFASKHKVAASFLDGLGMGIGFTIALVTIGAIRELLGNGTIFGIAITAGIVPNMLIAILPPGGFFIFGILVALVNYLTRTDVDDDDQLPDCEHCPSCGLCGASQATWRVEES